MAKKEYTVLMPIAGHAEVTVKAESPEAAIEAARNKITTDDIQDWEALEQFNKGNVCYCPDPWEVEVRNADGEIVEVSDDD